MLTAWTQHIKDQDEKVQFKTSLLHSKWILEHQSKIIGDIVKSLENKEISPQSYDNQNWAYRQAHANGFKQAMNMILKLNNLDQKDTHDRQLTTEQ